MKKGGGSKSTIIIGPSKSLRPRPCSISGVRAKIIIIIIIMSSACIMQSGPCNLYGLKAHLCWFF